MSQSVIVPVAYEWTGLTFCPSCALRATNVGMLIAGLPLAPDMDTAIATIALTQIERGLDVETPVAVMKPEAPACENCRTAFPTHSEEVV